MATLITGASTGIGEEFARTFAARGHDLVLVARNRDRLDALAADLRDAHGINTTVVAMDLTAPGAAADLWQRTRQTSIDIDVVVNNAGFATHGDLIDADPLRLAAQVQLNCSVLVELSARFLPAMRARGQGSILNIASTAGFQPVPHMAVYSATKAFVLTFTEALWAEERRHGIRVLAVCPGATDTPFFDTAGDAAAVGRKRTTPQVVETALKALAANKPSVVDGVVNAATARVATRLLPRRLVIAIAGRAVNG